MPEAILFQPFRLRGVELRNRIVVSPMCQYSGQDGFAGDWHLVHLGSRASGGAGLVFTEAVAVAPEGRISPDDLGLWSDEQVGALSRITRFVSGQGAAPGIQLAHAGRKAGTAAPWKGGGPVGIEDGGWLPVAPSPLAFDRGWPVPCPLDDAGIKRVVEAFQSAAGRAAEAGFKVAEVHAAHGYLLHEFLSPLTNHRTDRFGGCFENRTRLVKEVTAAVRQVWPEELPLFVRISATDWVDGGWDLEQSVELARALVLLGVDLVDCSSGGLLPNAVVPAAPGFQVPFAREIRRKGGVPTGAVGLITESVHAESILEEGDADLVFMGRQFLREPYWPLRAARELGVELEWPAQYRRARI